ncbi:DUF2971 domain-containing protein [Akkermansia muciniphila]|uniref:DUF2971 domain-containing protein n=1 Tax=Akkermansia muciniphila TaxID=239935 RepID=UPI00201CBDD2|nr:DUF2971 domain-containing protein [Akkermansia muciniphila]MCL6685791.1 DUF2971 domain-containing protein [Akkermansia muciniphila]
MTEENIEYIDAYIFMTYENMLKTLEKGRLKLLDPEKCNDPFEFMPASPTISEDGATSFDSNYLRKENGLLCFTKTYNPPSMWAHYADNHKGCCVHFRFPALPKQNSCVRNLGFPEYPSYIYRKLLIEHEGKSFFSITQKTTNDVVLWDVLYLEERFGLNEISAGYSKWGDQEEFAIDPVFITKDKSWEYEQEQRIIIPKPFPTEAENNLIFVGGFNEYIKSVILGLKCNESPDTTKKRINGLTHECLRDKMIPVHKAEIHPIKFDIISPEHEDFLKKLKENGE